MRTTLGYRKCGSPLRDQTGPLKRCPRGIVWRDQSPSNRSWRNYTPKLIVLLTAGNGGQKGGWCSFPKRRSSLCALQPVSTTDSLAPDQALAYSTDSTAYGGSL